MGSLGFNVCTYNMGADKSYYRFACMYKARVDANDLNNEYTDGNDFLSKHKDPNNFLEKYDLVQNKTAELLKDKADVYCLQAVTSEERPLIRSLTDTDKKFTIVHAKNNPSCV